MYLFVLSTSCSFVLQRTCLFYKPPHLCTCLFRQPPACCFCNVLVCFINLLLVVFATYLFVLQTSSLIPLSLKTAQRYNNFLIYANIPVFFYSPALNTSLPRISVAVWLLWIFRYVPSCLSSSITPELNSGIGFADSVRPSCPPPFRFRSLSLPPPFHCLSPSLPPPFPCQSAVKTIRPPQNHHRITIR